jgi:hypothetical protein
MTLETLNIIVTVVAICITLTACICVVLTFDAGLRSRERDLLKREMEVREREEILQHYK